MSPETHQPTNPRAVNQRISDYLADAREAVENGEQEMAVSWCKNALSESFTGAFLPGGNHMQRAISRVRSTCDSVGEILARLEE